MRVMKKTGRENLLRVFANEGLRKFSVSKIFEEHDTLHLSAERAEHFEKYNTEAENIRLYMTSCDGGREREQEMRERSKK